MTKGDFQGQVNVAQAPAAEGDFASKNPRFTYDAGPGGLVAGPAGVTIGRFAWATAPLDGDGAPATVANTGFGPVTGFVHREQQGLITTYLASSGMFIPGGFGLTLMTNADLWVKNSGTAEAVPGQKAYAAFADGTITFAATGTPTTGGTSTASTITPTTFSVTGTVVGNLMTVTAVGSGTVVPGATISGTGVTSGSQVVSQLTPLLSGESAGGVGRYLVNYGEQNTASITISGTYGLLTVGGTVVSGFAVGQSLAVSGSVVAGTSITALGTGTGGSGTYVVNNNTNVGSQAINSQTNVETKWIAMSSGLAGELVKISAQALG